MLDEDSDDQEDSRDDDEPELMLQRMLFVMMLVFVRAVITMYVLVFVLVRMRMCHIFALFYFHAAKIRHIFCNLVAKSEPTSIIAASNVWRRLVIGTTIVVV